MHHNVAAVEPLGSMLFFFIPKLISEHIGDKTAVLRKKSEDGKAFAPLGESLFKHHN